MTTYFVQPIAPDVTIITDYKPDGPKERMPFGLKILLLVILVPFWYLFLPLWLTGTIVGFWAAQEIYHKISAPKAEL